MENVTEGSWESLPVPLHTRVLGVLRELRFPYMTPVQVPSPPGEAGPPRGGQVGKGRLRAPGSRQTGRGGGRCQLWDPRPGALTPPAGCAAASSGGGDSAGMSSQLETLARWGGGQRHTCPRLHVPTRLLAHQTECLALPIQRLDVRQMN